MGVDPISLAMMGAAIGGGLVKAGGAMAAGDAANNAAMYRAQVAENNAKIAEQNVQWAEQAGAAKEGMQNMKTAQTVGGIKTAQGASGVNLDTGSAADVRAAAAALGELDALTIRSNTAREAYGYRVQGQSDKAQAELDRMQGAEAQRAGKVSALSSLLESASSVGGKYASWKLGAGASTAGSSIQLGTAENNWLTA